MRSHPLQTQTMSIPNTAILETKSLANHSKASVLGGNKQKLSKSMTEPHLDTSKIRQKYQYQLARNSTSSNHVEQQEEAEAKNGCAIM